MHVCVTGSSGLVGSALLPLLQEQGYQVTRLVRGAPGPEQAQWNPVSGQIDRDCLSASDAVVHLAGENIARGRWTAAKKARIRDSRVEGTRLLCDTLARLEARPRVLVSASAIGYYGDRGDEWLREDSEAGRGFLPAVCQEWEAATQPAAAAGVRVVQMRFGIILSKQGGALAKMLLPFRLGGGGVVGSGRQYWSWISLDDVVGAIHHAILSDELSGPVNAVAPGAATNAVFTKALGRVLSRPTLIPMPAFAAKLALGEMANDLLLASTRVEPRRLVESGYQFQHADLEEALRQVLGMI